jgi:hypothetical protein
VDFGELNDKAIKGLTEGLKRRTREGGVNGSR